MTLLDKAKKITMQRTKRNWGREHFELTEAWLNGEISLSQVAQVIALPGKKPHQQKAMNMFAYCLRTMKRQGLIKIIKPKTK